MQVYLIGYPSDYGGANSEALDTIKLWRRHGVRVVLIPSDRNWGPPKPAWRKVCDDLGCETVVLPWIEGGIRGVPGIAGSPVVSFCNHHFYDVYPTLREMGCRTVWVPCMCNWSEGELGTFDAHGWPHHLIFQSWYQANKSPPPLCHLEKVSVIRGAFDPWPYRETRDSFVVGKLARAAPNKWPANLWELIGDFPSLCMGFDARVLDKIGPAPPQARIMVPGQMPPQEFMRGIDVLLAWGDVDENWPRVGLEAMSSGVVVVAPNRWGWREMIADGQTGILCDDDDGVIAAIEMLAADRAKRDRIARNARKWIDDYCASDEIWRGWERVLFGEKA